MTIIFFQGLVTMGMLLPVTMSMAIAKSPWAAAKWTISVNVGREPGTEMPAEWGSSGARLAFPIEVAVESEKVNGNNNEEHDVMGAGAMRIRPLRDPTFVSSKGEQTVVVREGGWKITPPPKGQFGYAATLRFYLDVKVGATRNDVTLPSERLYFFTPCWREEELERGRRKLEPIVAATEAAQARLDAQLSHETGDRRLDGDNPIDTALAYKDMAVLVKERDDMLARQREAEKVLPKNANQLPRGFWPGTTESLAVGPGSIFVRRKKLFGDEFHVLGKWQAIPVAVAYQEEAR